MSNSRMSLGSGGSVGGGGEAGGSTPVVAPVRFEQVVGASPATLPVGTYELAFKATGAGTIGVPRILISDLTTTNQSFGVAATRANQGNIRVTLRYTPSTRQLIYNFPAGTNASLKAIGEA